MDFVKPDDKAFANVLLYGPPKTGKTAGACSAPGAVLLLNADLPNATRYAQSQNPGGRIMEVKFEGLRTLHEIGTAIMQQSTWDTVVVDPVGELYRRLLEEASNRAVRPTLNQYGDVGTHLERFCRFLCEAPVNVVLVAHESSVKDETTGTFERLPMTGTTNPALGSKIMGMVDIVGYTGTMEVEGEGRKYVAQLVTAGGRRGGDRFDVLGDWRELNLAEWFEAAGVHTGNDNGAEAPKEAVAA